MRGKNHISDRVITRVINQAARSVPGVETISSSWAEIGTRSYPRCDFQLDSTETTIQVESYLAIGWPSPVTDVAGQVQRTIQRWLKDMVGLQATQINVTVEQTVPAAVRVTALNLNAVGVAPTLTTIPEPPAPAVASPTVADGRAVVSPQVAESVDVRSPQTQSAAALVEISTPAEREVTSPTVADVAELTEIRVPEPAPLAEVEVPAETRLATVVEPGDREVYHPRLPQEQHLAPVTIAPHRPLASIGTRAVTADRQVTMPPQRPLSPITISPFYSRKEA